MTFKNEQAPLSLDEEINAYMEAEGVKPEASFEQANAEPAETKDEDEDPEVKDDAEEPVETEDAEVHESEEKPEVDTEAVLAAVKSKDVAALMKALGPAADEMLTSKAHVTLRLQIRDLEKATSALTATKAEVADLSEKLKAKYGDPIEARKKAEAGDVDGFLDMVEKWSNMSWNDTLKWAAKAIAGRPEKLPPKQESKKEEKAPEVDAQAQETAIKETKAWISTGLSKIDANLVKDLPEVVDMCLEEIRVGFKNGIDSPAKALPLAKKKLKEKYSNLARYFSKTGSKSSPAPSSKISTSGKNGKTRPLTVEEMIAETLAEHNVK